MAFVQRAGANPIGRQVKIADLRDNIDLSRIADPSERDHDRIAKYKGGIGPPYGLLTDFYPNTALGHRSPMKCSLTGR